MEIRTISKTEYGSLLLLWERSVRASHHFLKDIDIEFFKPLILNEYLDLLDLFCIRSAGGQILAFSGVSEGNLEMLFVDPDSMGKGLGKKLLFHAIEKKAVTRVDVNEENTRALDFYLSNGFVVVGRSELDGTGKPYPLLHLELTSP